MYALGRGYLLFLPDLSVLHQIQSGYQDVLSGSTLSSTSVTSGSKKQDGDGGNANRDL